MCWFIQPAGASHCDASSSHAEAAPPAYDLPFTRSEEDLLLPEYSSSSYIISSPLGPIHYARPEAVSCGVHFLARLLSGSLLNKLIERSKQRAIKRDEEFQAKLANMSEQELQEHQRKAKQIIEEDAIMAANMRTLGL